MRTTKKNGQEDRIFSVIPLANSSASAVSYEAMSCAFLSPLCPDTTYSYGMYALQHRGAFSSPSPARRIPAPSAQNQNPSTST